MRQLFCVAEDLVKINEVSRLQIGFGSSSAHLVLPHPYLWLAVIQVEVTTTSEGRGRDAFGTLCGDLPSVSECRNAGKMSIICGKDVDGISCKN